MVNTLHSPRPSNLNETEQKCLHIDVENTNCDDTYWREENICVWRHEETKSNAQRM